ncbi:MAG: cell wall-binding repeat-containing protein, partial [Firmicutes bacterium]|nr:cell wall-binding repeat-containing protein [Bacillota bacterium]
GTFTAYPSLPVAGPLIQNPILVLPTGHRSLIVADGAPPSAVSIAGEALQPLAASSVEIGVDPSGGALAVPMQTGVGWIDPSQSSSPLLSTAATASTPTGAAAMTTSGSTAVGLSTAIQWFSANGTASPPTATYAQATPLALAPVSGGIATLLNNGMVVWPNGTQSDLPSGMVSLAAVPSGVLAVGSGSMVGISPASPSPWLSLSNPGFVGPLAVTPDGGYALTSDGQSNTLQLVSLNPAADLGPIPLDPLSLPSGQSAGAIEGLALSPSGSTLYALTANGIALFQGPALTLSASPSTATVGSQVTLTATLTTSQGQPAAGVPVTFSTGATVATDASGQASTTATLNGAGPTLFTASTPGAVAQVTVTVTPAAPPPAPPAPSSGGGGSGGGGPSTGGPGSPSPSPQWTVVVTPPEKLGPNPPPLSLQQPARLPAPLPQGTLQYLFAVASGGQPYYPARYHLLVEAPPGYLHPFSLWYYSPNFGQWFPLLPTRVGPGRYEAMAPFLTQFAISDAPYPTALSLSGDRAERSAAVAEATFPLGARAAILANQGYDEASPPDALVATPLAAYLKAPVLLTPASSLPVALRQLLGRLKVQEVYIVGGPRAISPAIRGWLAAQGYTVKALFDGIDRYETASLVARYLRAHSPGGSAGSRVYLANGADVGASAPLAALAFTADAGPILYTSPAGLPPFTGSALGEGSYEVVEAAPASDFVHTKLTSSLLARLQTLLAGGADLAQQVDRKLTELGAFWVSAWHQSADAVLAGLYERLYRVPMDSPGPQSASASLWHILL